MYEWEYVCECVTCGNYVACVYVACKYVACHALLVDV